MDENKSSLKEYQAVIIVAPRLSEERLKALQDEFERNLQEGESGKILESETKKQRLVYPIKKFKEGIYLFYRFTATAGIILKIKDSLKHKEEILRISFFRAKR